MGKNNFQTEKMSGDFTYTHCALCNHRGEFKYEFLAYIQNDIGITIPDGAKNKPKADKYICHHCVKELRRYFKVPFTVETEKRLSAKLVEVDSNENILIVQKLNS